MKNSSLAPSRRILKIALSVLLALCALVALVLIGFIGYAMLPVSAYYGASERAFEIPGLSDNFVPQGFCYDEERDYFLISGHFSNDEASPIYIVDRASGELVKRVSLKKPDGEDFTGHSGGVALWGDYVYVAGGASNCLFVFSYSDLLTADTASYIGKFSLKASEDDLIRASCVTVEGGYLTVAEFYDGGAYLTLDSHKITTTAGDKNNAMALVFEMSESAEFGIKPEAIRAYSLPDKVQGVCYDGERVYLSTSYGLSHSFIYEYDTTRANAEGIYTLFGQSLPLYSLDSACLIGEYRLPPMSEEIVILDGRLYTMCESACNKYIFGKFTAGKWCYSTDLSAMKK